MSRRRKSKETQKEVDLATSRLTSCACYRRSTDPAIYDVSSIIDSSDDGGSQPDKRKSRLSLMLNPKDKLGNLDAANDESAKKTTVHIERPRNSLLKRRHEAMEMEFESHLNFFLPTKHYRDVSSTVSLSSDNSETYRSYVPTPLTQVLPSLYLGTQEDAEEGHKMLKLGVTHILSIVGGSRYSNFGTKHLYVPLRDNGSSDLVGELERSYDFMVDSQKPDNKLFIHCQLGQNRSASFVIGFLMRFKKLCLYEAYTFLKEKRELIHPHHKYIKQLRELDLTLNQVYSTPENFLQISICPQGNINIKHENFSRVMSVEYKRRQSVEEESNVNPAIENPIMISHSEFEVTPRIATTDAKTGNLFHSLASNATSISF